ncbi:hypothetical protein GCM10011579_003330 [Streptomyces albiflavescens]|uniref:PPM-type phosphatase domain-containing protein n=1 Tax=Streptomyces albiflavescens TaxID=1623582 RepID=A0A917XQP9_9ACTN|nr:SpoIIE family protein phosphatase [Streptomyces albiflavescens]GGN49537.1 hypothetical protein GCM10011579_003330 [Streptomyces albiflavescens]
MTELSEGHDDPFALHLAALAVLDDRGVVVGWNRRAQARAGHPPPVVTAPDGQVAPLDVPAGPPLGLGGLPFEAREMELPEGSLLRLYTNGLIGERHIDADIGLTKLCAALTRPADALERTCQAVVDSLVPSRPSDDVALLIARTRMLPPDDVASWRLPRRAAIQPGLMS